MTTETPGENGVSFNHREIFFAAPYRVGKGLKTYGQLDYDDSGLNTIDEVSDDQSAMEQIAASANVYEEIVRSDVAKQSQVEYEPAMDEVTKSSVSRNMAFGNNDFMDRMSESQVAMEAICALQEGLDVVHGTPYMRGLLENKEMPLVKYIVGMLDRNTKLHTTSGDIEDDVTILDEIYDDAHLLIRLGYLDSFWSSYFDHSVPRFRDIFFSNHIEDMWSDNDASSSLNPALGMNNGGNHPSGGNADRVRRSRSRNGVNSNNSSDDETIETLTLDTTNANMAAFESDWNISASVNSNNRNAGGSRAYAYLYVGDETGEEETIFSESVSENRNSRNTSTSSGEWTYHEFDVSDQNEMNVRRRARVRIDGNSNNNNFSGGGDARVFSWGYEMSETETAEPTTNE